MPALRSSFTSLSVLLGGLLLMGLLPTSALAQTPTTTIQNGNDDTRLQLNYDGGFYVPGTFLNDGTENDSIPATGAGTRLMWYPAQAAFRAGRVGANTGKDDVWNADSVGRYSSAFGLDTKANGAAAVAMGDQATASGTVAIAMGFNTNASGLNAVATGAQTSASGNVATAMGGLTAASGTNATAMGFETNASGDQATATGLGTTAATNRSLASGKCNSSNTSSDGTLFVVGNGFFDFSSRSCNSQADALVLKQDGDLAVGPSDPQDLRLHVAKDKPNAGVSDNPGANMVLFENTNDGTRPDVLGLQAGPTDPGSGVTYVSFYQRDGTTIGGIEGNGSGGVNYATSGSDYAEELPVSGGAPAPEPTDLVGVRGGEVHLSTERADRVMIASDQPAVTGNTTPSTETDDARRVAVAFIGQVPVRLRGEASVGDLVVASGQDDGTARAVSPGEYRRAEHGPIAGQAWSAKSTEAVGEVTVAVGLGHSGAVAERLDQQQSEIASLQDRVQKLEDLEARLAHLDASSQKSRLAGVPGSELLLGLLLGGLFGAGLLWRRRS